MFCQLISEWNSGPGQLSRYSDSLRAGPSGDRIQVGARSSTSVHIGPGAHPASCTMGTGSFPGVKRPGRGADLPPPSKCRYHERVRLYFYSPSGLQWPVTGRIFTPLPRVEQAVVLNGMNEVYLRRSTTPMQVPVLPLVTLRYCELINAQLSEVQLTFQCAGTREQMVSLSKYIQNKTIQLLTILNALQINCHKSYYYLKKGTTSLQIMSVLKMSHITSVFRASHQATEFCETTSSWNVVSMSRIKQLTSLLARCSLKATKQTTVLLDNYIFVLK